jgi:DNA-binding NtrC family response regulator
MSHKYKMLIIEDDNSICEIYKTGLSDKYDIEVCNNICDAELLINEKGNDNWDVFICDLKVPYNRDSERKDEKFNTFDLLNSVIDTHKTIIVTGYMSPEIKDIVLSMDIFAILEKPADMKNLKILINSMMKCYGK